MDPLVNWIQEDCRDNAYNMLLKWASMVDVIMYGLGVSFWNLDGKLWIIVDTPSGNMVGYYHDSDAMRRRFAKWRKNWA